MIAFSAAQRPPLSLLPPLAAAAVAANFFAFHFDPFSESPFFTEDAVFAIAADAFIAIAFGATLFVFFPAIKSLKNFMV